MDTGSYSKDHDLLIEINTKMERVITDVSELKNNFAERVNSLEEEKVDKEDFDDIRNSVRWLQRIAYTGLGVLGALEFFFQYFHK